MTVEPQRGQQVPANAHRARPELCPALVVDVRAVLQLEPTPAVGLAREPQLDPRHVATVLPGRGKSVRFIAVLDRAVTFRIMCRDSVTGSTTVNRGRGSWRPRERL